MEKIFFVINNELSEVNEELKKGASVKMIQTVSKGNGSGDNVYAYVVLDYVRPR